VALGLNPGSAKPVKIANDYRKPKKKKKICKWKDYVSEWSAANKKGKIYFIVGSPWG
jgi:hypothetical protein